MLYLNQIHPHNLTPVPTRCPHSFPISCPFFDPLSLISAAVKGHPLEHGKPPGDHIPEETGFPFPTSQILPLPKAP